MTRLILAVVKGENGRSRDAIAELEKLADDVVDQPAVSRLTRISLNGALIRAGRYDRVPYLEPLLVESRDADDGLATTFATGLIAGGLLGQGHVAEAVRLAEQYIEMEEPFRSVMPAPHVILSAAYLGADRLDDARRVCQEGRRRASEVGEVAALAVYGAFESVIGFVGGAWDEAGIQAEIAFEQVAYGTGSPVALLLAHATLAQISLRRGRLDEARRSVDEGERMVSEKGPEWGMEMLAWTKALCIEASSDPTQALDAFVVGWDSSASDRYFFGRPAFPDLVRLALAADDRARAVQATEEAEEGMRRAEEVPSVVGAALRCRGILEGDVDLLVAAVDAYRKSARILETAMACEDAGRSLARRGRTSDARSFFDEALTMFDDMGAINDSARVLAAMRSAGIGRGSRGPRGRPAMGWDALTPAERKVARLTVEGHTNHQIAERLFISKYTVQTHLSHIFTKLGIKTRAELAAEAARRGL